MHRIMTAATSRSSLHLWSMTQSVWKRSIWSANAKLWRSAGRTIYGTQKSHYSPASAQYWTSSRVAGTLSLDTSLGFPKTRQLTKHSGVTSTYLSDTFLIKAGGAVRAAQATDGLTRSAGTTTTYHQLICGGEVIRGWRYGPCRYVLTTTTTTSHIWAFNVHNHRQDVWHLKTSIQCFDAAGRMESHPTLNGSPTIPEVHSSPFRDSA